MATLRRLRSAATPVLVAVVLLGSPACGTSGGNDDGFESLTDVRDALGEKGYACKADPKPYKADKDELDLGVEPVRDITCTIDGREVTITEFRSAAQVKRLEEVVDEVVCAFAEDRTKVVWATDGPYVIATEESTKADAALVTRMGKAIDADIQSVTCEGNGDGKSGEKTTTTESERTTTTRKTTTTSAASAKPADARASELLQGNASPPFPAGSPGGIAVVATGSALGDDGALPLVVRNNTADAAYGIAATGRALQGGKLVGSGESQGFQPAVVQPGEVAIGYVYFGDTVPDGATFELAATADDEPGEIVPEVGLPVTELNLLKGQFGNTIVGTVTSPLDHAVDQKASALAMCFDEAGKPLSTHSGYTDGEQLPAKGTASFSIDLFDDPCPVYLVGSSVNDF